MVGIEALLAGLVLNPANTAAQSWTAQGGGGGKIVYSDHARICVVNADGSGREMLSASDINAYSPRWSPEGNVILFVVEKDTTHSSICVMDADGGNVRALKDAGAHNNSPQWSPDGKHISFVSTRDSKYSELYVMDADGRNVRRLAPGAYVDSMGWIPQWSPDGTQLLFVRTPGNAGARICVVNADGTNLHTVAEGGDKATWYNFALWADGGKKICCSQGFLSGNLIVMDADGSNPQNPEGSGVTMVSGDGQKIATRLSEMGSDSRNIKFMDLDGGNAVSVPVISADANGDPNGQFHWIIWSPDGRQVACAVGDGLYVVNADGSAVRALNAGAEADQLITEGNEAMKNKDYQGALDDYHKAEALNTNFVEIHKLLAAPLLALGEYQEAADELGASPGDECRECGKAFIAKQQYQTALVFLEKDREVKEALGTYKDYTFSTEWEIGVAYLGAGDGERAAAAFERCLATPYGQGSSPYKQGSLMTRVYLAHAYNMTKRYEKALEIATPAPGLYQAPTNGLIIGDNDDKENHIDAYLELGWANQGLSHQADAITDFDIATALDPTQFALQFLLGKAYVWAGQYAQGIDTLNKSLGLDSGDAQAYAWLGQAQFGQGNCAKATHMYELAHQIDAQDANVCTWLGYLYKLQGQYAQADAVARETIAIDPGNPRHYQDAADACLGLAQYDEALALLDKGTAFQPDIGLDRYRTFVSALKEGIPPAPAGTIDWQFELSRWLTIENNSPWHRGLSDEDQVKSRALAAENGGNLYAALDLYTWLFKNCRDRADNDKARLEDLRQHIFALYRKLPVKLCFSPLAADLARKADEQARMSVTVGDGNRFGSAERFYLMALDEAPWWADGYYNVAVAQGAQDTTLCLRNAIVNMRLFISLSDDSKQIKEARQMIDEWSKSPFLGGPMP